MSVDRYTQTAHVKAAERRRLLDDMKQLAADIDRSQATINAVVANLNAVNQKFQGDRNTKQEVEYLTALLDCAKRKLAWEKQIASLQKRAPAMLESMTRVLNDNDHPASDELKAELLKSLQSVQAALQKLQGPESGPQA